MDNFVAGLFESERVVAAGFGTSFSTVGDNYNDVSTQQKASSESSATSLGLLA